MKRAIAMFVCVLCLAMTVQAKAPANGKYMDKEGHIFIMKNGKPQKGYFKYRGKWYYGHGHASKKYPRGSVTTGELRITSTGRWYAFASDGTMITKDTFVRKGRTRRLPVLDIRSRDHTVRYIYGTTRFTIGHRYSTAEMRMQEMDDNGKWRTVEGMPFVPEYVDLQR